ncbi:unnamed protein product [Musa acuminata subsp. burmannicoides]
MVVHAFRLYDDLATSKTELARGDVPKSIQCYMHEKIVSEDVAREKVRELIRSIESTKWKSDFSLHWKNTSRGWQLTCLDGPIYYEHGDGYGIPDGETKNQVMLLFIQPIEL